MKARTFILVFAVVLVLAAPGMSIVTCFYVSTGPDGRVLGPYSLSGSTDDLSLAFGVESNRSYSVEVITQQGSSTGGGLVATININNMWCPTSNISTGVAITDTTLVSPKISDGAGAERRAIVVSTAPGNGYLEMRVHNSDASPSQVVVSVSETTIYSPAWSTYGTVQTFYSFQNTTGSTLSGTLKLYDSLGALVQSANLSLPVNGTASTNTSSLGTTRNKAGTAIFVHNGPPGAVLCEAVIANFSVVPPYVQPVKCSAPRESTH